MLSPTPQAEYIFNKSLYRDALYQRRGNLTLREASQQAGISTSTLSRMERGLLPDLSTFLRACTWMQRDPIQFFSNVSLTPMCFNPPLVTTYFKPFTGRFA